MQYEDHNPPHIHLIYAEFKGVAMIQSKKIQGKVPVRVKKIVKEWIELRENELLENWKRAQEHKILFSIDPLI